MGAVFHVPPEEPQQLVCFFTNLVDVGISLEVVTDGHSQVCGVWYFFERVSHECAEFIIFSEWLG